MKANFDTSVELNDVLEGENGSSEQKTTDQSKQSSAPEGSRQSQSSRPHSSPSRTHQEAFKEEAKYYNGFNDGGRYV